MITLDEEFILECIRYKIGPWYILSLPDGEFGALWEQGIPGDCEYIAEGKYNILGKKGSYEEVLSFVRDNVRELAREYPDVWTRPNLLKKKFTKTMKNKLQKYIENFYA